jgi:hypothetical protein
LENDRRNHGKVEVVAVNYRIVWQPHVEQLLIELWLAAPDRPAISEAVDALEVEFRRDPLVLGEERENGARIVFAGPLALLIQVELSQRIVFVKNIWRMG